MASNRKLPFGYRMELGKIVLHPQEAPMVQYIFQQYILGASYAELVNQLREQEVPYDKDKLWNKNMVARILENRKYIGQEGWPSIITAEQYQRAAEKRSCKANLPQKTEAQKLLRRLSGGTSRDLEQDVMCILNQLIAKPDLVHAPQAQAHDLGQITELRLALEHELEQQPVNEEAAKHLAMEIASAQYEAIRNQEYETKRLQRLFGSSEIMQELDADLLRSTVSQVQVRGCKVIIRLKNDQIIEKGGK